VSVGVLGCSSPARPVRRNETLYRGRSKPALGFPIDSSGIVESELVLGVLVVRFSFVSSVSDSRLLPFRPGDVKITFVRRLIARHAVKRLSPRRTGINHARAVSIGDAHMGGGGGEREHELFPRTDTRANSEFRGGSRRLSGRERAENALGSRGPRGPERRCASINARPLK